MKKLKFKSLTMRIWTIFTIVILIIICCISLLYIFAYRVVNENARKNDLKAAHDMLLKSNNFNDPNRFDSMKNLKASSSFLLKKDSSGNFSVVHIYKEDMVPMPSKTSIDNKSILDVKNVMPPPKIDSEAEKLWMSSFIKESTIKDKQYEGVYNNMKFMFIISSVTTSGNESTYLVSYMPDRPDNSLIYTVIVIGLFFIAVGFITSKAVAVSIAKPLKELEDYTVRIAHKDWKKPIEVTNSDEIGRLAASMNKMQQELKLADEEEKMFLQSISHDLKTPVMVIMSHADAILDGVYVDSVEKTAEIIRDEAISLEKKIKQLLYLNTLDYTLQNSSEDTVIKLHEMLLNIISRFEVVNSSIEWDLDIDELTLFGNEEKIQISIENIIDNALRYAENKIFVRLKSINHFIEIEVYNDGPNIKKEHVDHIFNNMYKDKTGNFGLGLAISKKIINFYKGDVKAVNREKGVSFIIRFPGNSQH